MSAAVEPRPPARAGPTGWDATMAAYRPMATPPEPARPAPAPARPAAGLREAAADPANWGATPAALARRLGLAPPTYAETMALLGEFPRLGTRAGREVAAFARAVDGYALEAPPSPEWFDAFAEAHSDLVEAIRPPRRELRGGRRPNQSGRPCGGRTSRALGRMLDAIPRSYVDASLKLATLSVELLVMVRIQPKGVDPDRDPYSARLESVAGRAIEIAAGLAPGRELWALDALDAIDRRRGLRRRAAGTDAASHWWVRHEEASDHYSTATHEYRLVTDAARLLFRSRERDAARVRAARGLGAPESYAHLAAIERRAGRRFDPRAAFADPRWRHLPVPPRLVEAAAALADHDSRLRIHQSIRQGRSLGHASEWDLAGVTERYLAHVRMTLPHLNFADAPIVVPDPPPEPSTEYREAQAELVRSMIASIRGDFAAHAADISEIMANNRAEFRGRQMLYGAQFEMMPAVVVAPERAFGGRAAAGDDRLGGAFAPRPPAVPDRDYDGDAVDIFGRDRRGGPGDNDGEMELVD